MVRGIVVNHTRDRSMNGRGIYTEYLKEFRFSEHYRIAVSVSGRMYLLYNNKHHPRIQDVPL